MEQPLPNEIFQLEMDKITSFIVPFAGPHECPNPKSCPNNLISNDIDKLDNNNEMISPTHHTGKFLTA